jgi:hypothetical protein
MTSENAIRRQVGRYRVNFHELRTPITITLWLNVATDHIDVEYSHNIKTPVQIDAYAPDCIAAYDAGLNLDAIVSRRISVMDSFYEQAVAAGHAPSESWIVPV